MAYGLDAEKRKQYYLVEARKYLAAEDISRAQSAYSKVNDIDRSDWEAYFYFWYLEVCASDIKSLEKCTDELTNCLEYTISCIYTGVRGCDQENAISEVCERVYKLAESNGSFARKEYYKIDSSVRNKYEEKYLKRQVATKYLLFTLAERIRQYFGDNSKITKIYAVKSYEKGISFCELYFSTTPDSYAGYEDLMEKLSPGSVGSDRIERRMNYYRQNIDKLEKKKNAKITPINSVLSGICATALAICGFITMENEDGMSYLLFAGALLCVLACFVSFIVYKYKKTNVHDRINKCEEEISEFEKKLSQTKKLYKR